MKDTGRFIEPWFRENAHARPAPVLEQPKWVHPDFHVPPAPAPARVSECRPWCHPDFRRAPPFRERRNGAFSLSVPMAQGRGQRARRRDRRVEPAYWSPAPHPADHVPLASGSSLEGLTRYARGRPQARVGRRARGTERVRQWIDPAHALAQRPQECHERRGDSTLAWVAICGATASSAWASSEQPAPARSSRCPGGAAWWVRVLVWQTNRHW